MQQLTVHVRQAARCVADGCDPSRDWNPVYRALTPHPPGASTGSRTEATGATETEVPTLSADETELVTRQLAAPALMVIAVTQGDSTCRLRIAPGPRTAALESSRDDGPSVWRTAPTDQVPAAIGELLDGCGIALDPPRLMVEGAGGELHPSPDQVRAIRRSLDGGASPEDAFAGLPDLDPRLRDALAADGPRIALSLTLHDRTGCVVQSPVTFSRLWVQGEMGMHRIDAEAPLPAVLPVTSGDILGTALPLLEEAMRFTAACTGAGGPADSGAGSATDGGGR